MELGKNILLPSEQEDQMPIFLTSLSRLFVAGRWPILDGLQLWACCLPGIP